MNAPRPPARRPAQHAAALGLALVLNMAAHAAPPEQTAVQAAPDGLTQLLVERGLLPGAATGLVQTMRDRASDMVLSAMNFLGVPYKRGGSSEDGFDCSGFTRHVFEMSLGLVLPRRADEQARAPGLVPVRKDELKPGDLVFFNTLRATFSHVGIYIGDGKFIHAPRTGANVRVEDMRQAYWVNRFTGARRAEVADTSSAATGGGLLRHPADLLQGIVPSAVASPAATPGAPDPTSMSRP